MCIRDRYFVYTGFLAGPSSPTSSEGTSTPAVAAAPPAATASGSEAETSGAPRAPARTQEFKPCLLYTSALNCILAQRLVRVICEHCKRPVSYPDALLIESGLNPDEWRDVPFMDGPGCFECGGTGFRGRSAIHELLDLTRCV